MSARNVLLILSDEHARNALGCYGNREVHTPNLDALAAAGIRFDRAYTPSPVCVPARASIATGRYVHEIGYWSNSQAYDGQVQSWGHRLRKAGHQVVSVGKLHYQSSENDNGFLPELIPLHIRDGVGWVRGLLGREPGSTWEGTAHFAREIGPGSCDYTHYDNRVCEVACEWLEAKARTETAKPWVMCASFVSPHYPLIVPSQYFDLYDPDTLQSPRLNEDHQLSRHPVIAGVRRYLNYDDYFDADSRQIARASYYGLCSFVDYQIGRLLQALQNSGQADDTVIIYTSDHGEMAGNHGLWTKCVMYEDSVGIPLIMSGADVPAGVSSAQPVSLIDLYPTILEIATPEMDQRETSNSMSLFTAAAAPRENRAVISEYHDGGSITGMFMLRTENWKYTYYPGYEPQLFDMVKDPHEEHDQAMNSQHAGLSARLEDKLRGIVNPEEVNQRVFSEQNELIEKLGGPEAILATTDYDQSPVPEY